MLRATLDVARRADRAEIDFCALTGGIGLKKGVDSLEVGGGRALYGRPGSPLNKVLGLGLTGAVSDADLDRLEAFYATRGAPVQIELCPLAHVQLAPRLCARGYIVQGFENELGRALPVTPPIDVPPGVRVERTTSTNEEVWIRVTAEGFAAADPAPGGGALEEITDPEVLVAVVGQFVHGDMMRYLAWVDGRPAGAVATWLHDGVLGVAGAATLQAFRRRGVQTAVIAHALNEPRGADLAIATTLPGSTSQGIFERLGFQVLYTRTVFVKPCATS